MPAVLSLSMFAGSFLSRWVKQTVRAVKNRHTAAMLARLDDRMLADIGITRSDLRDAYSEPLWHDPTDMLARRAAERRRSRRQTAFDCSTHRTANYPSADRPAQYLI